MIIQQHVLWFEVSVDDPLLVEVLHALDDLSGVVAGSWLVKPRVVLIYIINVIPRCIREGGCMALFGKMCSKILIGLHTQYVGLYNE